MINLLVSLNCLLYDTQFYFGSNSRIREKLYINLTPKTFNFINFYGAHTIIPYERPTSS